MSTETADQLMREHDELTRRLNAGPDAPQARERLRSVTKRLREIRATPPAGYTLPKAAADLVAHADANGWATLVQWTPPDSTQGPHVTVQIGRKATAADRDLGPGPHWKYRLTWHSRNCPPGRLRRFGGIAATPEVPATHDAPSLTAIREVITSHPAPTPAED